MSKKRNKKGRRKFRIFLLIVISLILLLSIIVLLCTYVFDIKTKAIVIHGNNYITDSEILEQADLEDYPNFFLASGNKIEKSLKKDSFINKVKVKKNLLFQIHIYIEENDPLFIREDTDMIVFDINKETLNDTDIKLDVPYLINYVPNTKYKQLISKLRQLDYSLVKKISQIKYAPTKYDEDRFIFYMNDSNRVYINLPKMKSFNKYDEMVTKFEGKTGKLFLDSGNYFQIDK